LRREVGSCIDCSDENRGGVRVHRGDNVGFIILFHISTQILIVHNRWYQHFFANWSCRHCVPLSATSVILGQ